jgi:hypothetical protein
MYRRALERENKMTREEENRKVTDEILGMSGTETDFKQSLIMNANMIVSLLIDISKSLAVIADDISLRRDIEEQTRVYEQMGKREP